MDLTWLKWLIIILVVVGVGWLFTSGGVNYMENKFSKPAADDAAAVVNEAGLSKLGGFLLKTFRYDRARAVFERAMDTYPEGANYYYNYYRLVKCYEKLGRHQDAADALADLSAVDAHTLDERVPESSNLDLRRGKLIEVYELQG
jgi:tetratricopeptide (TPR) repeat protein